MGAAPIRTSRSWHWTSRSASNTTALTRYIDVADQVHNQVLVTMPFGEYHPKSGKDGELKVVAEKKQTAAAE